MNKRDCWGRWVLICIAVGCALRFVGLTRGTSDFVLPEQARQGETTSFYHFHPDEQLVVGAALQPVDLLDPPFTVYGLLPVYLLRGVLKTTAFALGWKELAVGAPESTRHVFYIARMMAVLFSCATLWLVWVTGRRYFDRSAACLGLTFVAFAPGAIQQAHFYIVDGLFLLLSVAAVYATLRAVEAGDGVWYIAAGVLIGAAGTVRLNGVSLGFVLLAGHLLKEWTKGETKTWMRAARSLTRPRLWMAAGAALGVLLLVEPFLVISPSRLLRAESVTDFGHAMAIVRGEILQTWVLADLHTTPYLDQWFDLWPLVSGWPLTWIFLLGAGYVLWNRDLYRGLMLIWCGVYFLPIGSLQAKAVRYVIPLLPFLSLFAGAFCIGCWRWVTFLRRRWIIRAALGLLVLHTIIYGLAFARIYLVEDSRLQAGRWMAENVPAGSKVGLEGGGFSMTGMVSGEEYGSVRLNITRVFYGAPYMLCRTQAEWLGERLAHMDYFVSVDINRAAQFTAVPDLFPAVADFYRQMMDDQLGFRRIRRFKNYPGFPGIKFNDDGAEPSFLGYDHPAIAVFKRKEDANQEIERWIQNVDADPRCADRSLQEAAAALQKDDLELARQLIDAAMSAYPFSKLPHLLKAEIYRRQGKSKLAEVALRNYEPERAQGLTAYVYNVSTIPDIPGATALSLAELGLPDMALQVLREGMETARSYPPEIVSAYYSYLDVASHFAKKDQIDRMEQVLSMAIQLHRNAETYNILALLAYQRGESARAMKLWTNSLSVNERQADIHAKMGKVALQELEDYEQALHHFERAVEIDANLGAELEQWIFTARRERLKGSSR